MAEVINVSPKWVRSNDGWFAGVCEGLSNSLAIEPWIVRIVWFASIWFFGAGLFVYLAAAISFPREDKALLNEKVFLGVCQKISAKTEIELGLVRFLTMLLSLGSFGLVFIAYIILYFTMPDED